MNASFVQNKLSRVGVEVGVGGGGLGYMKIKPTQPQLGLGLAELGNTPLEIEVKSVKGYWSHHSQGRHASRG